MSSEKTSENLPAGWLLRGLGEVAKWGSGGTPKSGTPAFYGGEIRWAVIGDLTESWVIETAQTITNAGLEKSSAKIIEPGTVMLAMYGASIGRTGIAAVEMATNQAIAFAVPIDGVLDAQYLLKYLQSQKEDFVRAGQGGAQPNISQTVIKPWPIPLPPIAEQVKIVEILEEQLSRLDAALASVRAVREKSARFRRSLLHAAFIGALTSHEGAADMLPSGWSTVRLGDCLEKLKSGKLVERGWSPQCLSQPSSDEDTWGVLKTTAVQMGDYWADFNKELPKSLEPKTGLEVNNGDFLMTTTGPRNRCGIVCLVNQTRKKLIFSGKILRFRADTSRLMPGWLMYLMMSPDIQKTFDEMKVGTSDSSVSIGNQQVLDLIIPIAPLDEQKRTLEILEAQFSRLEASLALADAIEKKASALRRSLLHAAFSGNLTKEWREGAHV